MCDIFLVRLIREYDLLIFESKKIPQPSKLRGYFCSCNVAGKIYSDLLQNRTFVRTRNKFSIARKVSCFALRLWSCPACSAFLKFLIRDLQVYSALCWYIVQILNVDYSQPLC